MEWNDEGIVLSVSRHGEADAVLELMTRARGRHRGYVKGGTGKRQRAVLQPGNRLDATWRSRIEENLGRYTTELIHSPLGAMIGDGPRMTALSAFVSVISTCLPEREPHESVFDVLAALIDMLEHDDVDTNMLGVALVKLELGILGELGYSLDFSECAATGAKDNLIYVSPKSAKAVSAEAGHPYRDRMLPLPAFLLNGGSTAEASDIVQGLALTGHFLDRTIWIVQGKGQPPARERFVAMLEK